MERLANQYIVQAWLVILLAFFFGISLAGVQLTLSPKIEANKINETRQKVPELVLGAEGAAALADSGQTLDIESRLIDVKRNGKKTLYRVFEARDKGNSAGWVVKSKGQGYADKIELLIGFSPDMETISGIFILDQKETPGLGNKIADIKWRKQFIDKALDRSLAVVKTGAKASNEIDAITGATISSRSVCTIINNTVSDLKDPLSTAASHKIKESKPLTGDLENKDG